MQAMIGKLVLYQRKCGRTRPLGALLIAFYELAGTPGALHPKSRQYRRPTAQTKALQAPSKKN